MSEIVLNAEEEVALRRQFEEAQDCALRDPNRALIAKIALQAIIGGREVVVPIAPIVGGKDHPKKRDRAEERRVWFRAWYERLGFEIEVPKPKVSNHEFDRRQKAGQALFYRPATSEVSYEAFMRAVGQSEHWTVVNEEDRKLVGWEPAAKGYWYWAEVSSECPRLGQTWNSLTASIRLLALEEYVITRHAHKAATDQNLDVTTWCWLRTRYGVSALDAHGSGGGVVVHRRNVQYLSIPFAHVGGRAAEVV